MNEFSSADVRMLLNALRIGAEDGSLFAQNNDGSANKADVARYERLRQKLAGDAVPNSETVAFRKLALGAKFRYAAGKGTVWVKIGHDDVAKWDVTKIATRGSVSKSARSPRTETFRNPFIFFRTSRRRTVARVTKTRAICLRGSGHSSALTFSR